MEFYTILPIVIGALFWALWLTGAVLNIMLMVMFIRHPEILTPENVFLINLCVVDLLYLLHFLKVIIELVMVYDETVCLILLFWRSFVLALSAYSVVAISMQRYLGIIKFENRLLEDDTNYKKHVLTVIGVWVAAILMAALEVCFIIFNDKYFCNADIGVNGYRLFLYGSIPSIIITCFCAKASVKVTRSAKNMPGIEHEALAELRKRRKRSAGIIRSFGLSFYLTYVPFLLCKYLLMNYDISMNNWVYVLIEMVVSLASVLNPFYNIIALCVASLKFRDLYKKYCHRCCCWCCCCRRQTQNSTRSEAALEQNTNGAAWDSQV